MARISAYVRACHPEPTAAVTALATALALSAGRGLGSLAVAGAFLSGQLSVGWSNDWIDAERDRGAGRTDKPVARADVSASALRTAALVAVTACVPLSLAMGLGAGVLHLLAVAAAWGYNARLKATVLSWAPYALAFGAVPSIITLGLPGNPWAPAWATVAGALLGVGAHLANVLPDIEADLAHGIRGLPHRLGRSAASAVSVVLLLAATTSLVLGPGEPDLVRSSALGLAVVVSALGLYAGHRPGSHAVFRAVLVVAVVDVALLVASGSSLAPT
ncbi:MAG: UbiA family prenyltransferase [Mycobacteriales bacterium]